MKDLQDISALKNGVSNMFEFQTANQEINKRNKILLALPNNGDYEKVEKFFLNEIKVLTKQCKKYLKNDTRN